MRHPARASRRYSVAVVVWSVNRDQGIGTSMTTRAQKKVVVLHSGGLDSTVCLLLAKQRGHSAISLGVSYNQHHQVELDYASAQCLRFGIERRIVSVAWTKPQREIPMDRTVDEIRAQASPAFLPGRNGLFLMLAAAEAAGSGANEFWTGINSVDFSGYPDCKPEFVKSFQEMLHFAIPGGPKLVAPLQLKTKPQIAKMAKKFGITKHDTWSCYRPKITPVGFSPCGKCDACKLHEFAWHGL